MKHEFTRARGPTIGLVIALGAILMQFDAAQSRDFCAVLQRVLATTDFGAQGPLRGFVPEGAVSSWVNPLTGYSVDLESISKSSPAATRSMRLRNVTTEVAACLPGWSVAALARSLTVVAGFVFTRDARSVEVAVGSHGLAELAEEHWLMVRVLPPGRRHGPTDASLAWRPPQPPRNLCEALRRVLEARSVEELKGIRTSVVNGDRRPDATVTQLGLWNATVWPPGARSATVGITRDHGRIYLMIYKEWASGAGHSRQEKERDTRAALEEVVRCLPHTAGWQQHLLRGDALGLAFTRGEREVRFVGSSTMEGTVLLLSVRPLAP
jgi:hypothetical protein